VILPLLTEIDKERDTAAATLHLAVRCAPCQSSLNTLPLLTVTAVSTIQLLLSHRAISPNGMHSDTSPLHLAASLGRADVVSLLLDQDSIDDSIRDTQGRTCRDLARSQHIAKLIDGKPAPSRLPTHSLPPRFTILPHRLLPLAPPLLHPLASIRPSSPRTPRPAFLSSCLLGRPLLPRRRFWISPPPRSCQTKRPPLDRAGCTRRRRCICKEQERKNAAGQCREG